MNTIKMLGGLSAMAVTATMLIAAPAHAGESASLVVTGTAIGKASSDGAIYGSTRLTVGGATQLTWEDSDHDLRVTRSQIRNAPKFKINAPGANSSKLIFKKAKQKNDGVAAKIVVLKKGSVVRNTGRLNLLLRGFEFTLPHDTVVVLDKKTKQYRIAYYIIGGKLVKQCGNYIGGNVPMEDKVVQVQHEEDVQLNGVAKAVAEVPISVSFKLTCPNGASFDVNAWAKAYGAATNTVSYTLRTQASTVASIELEAEKNIVINQDVYAEAGAGINVKATCGEDTPPPPPPAVPAYSCDSLTVNKSDNRMVNIANFSTSQSGGATFKHAVIEWGDGSSDTFVSPVGKTHSYAQYDTTYVVKATAVFVVNGMEKSVTSSACQAAVSFTAPPVVDTPPSVNGQVPEHVIYGDDALWADFDATDPEGHPITFEYSYDGPINIQAIEEINTSAGKRLSIKFSAKYVAPGTTQDAHFYVTAVANGKRSSQFVGTVQVANLG